MSGSTISIKISQEVFLGSASYASPLTITSTGDISAPAPNTSFQAASAVYANVIGGSIVNRGTIIGGQTTSYTAPAIFSTNPLNLNNYGNITGESGIYLQDGGTVINDGTIAGRNIGTLGGYGVRLVNAALENLKSVYGKLDGVAAWNASEVVNTGTITGETAGIRLASAYVATGGTLINTGKINGGVSGVTETSALITNLGSINGQTYGLRSSWGGTVVNTGHISGGVDGVLLLNGQYQAKYQTTFTNAGTIEGGYFALAVNFAQATNTAIGLISGTTFGAGVGASGYLFSRGFIYAIDAGLLTESGGRAINAGTIGSDVLGVELFSNSVLTNASSGFVYSLEIAALNQAAYLANAGTLLGNSYGLEILSGGIAINSGAVSSPNEGVYLSTLSVTSSPDFLVNSGTIYGQVLGINLKNGTVYSAGSIEAAQIAVRMVTSTSFNNSGYVYGGRYGVQLAGGTLVNTGSIGGKTDGIRVNRGDLTNAGTVTGAQYAIYGQSFALTIDPGAVFNGNVTDKTKTSRLNLAGSTPGTLTGLGTKYNGFDAINFEAGAHWLISGTSAGLAAKQVITGFEQGDTIILTGFSALTDNFSGVHLSLASGTVTEILIFNEGGLATADFDVTSNGTGTTISLAADAPCFVVGTRILTPRGEMAIETLRIGDRVITQSGEDQPIVWIGRRTIDLRLHLRPVQAQPVCIAANALGEDVPRRDLWVSPDHALLVDDVLVPAQLLLNGLNIHRGAFGRVTYYHLELARHAVIFAENAPAESYLETGNRNAFQNGGGGMMLHPDFSAMVRREKSCAPLLLAGKKLEEIRGRCLHRAKPTPAQRGA